MKPMDSKELVLFTELKKLLKDKQNKLKGSKEEWTFTVENDKGELIYYLDQEENRMEEAYGEFRFFLKGSIVLLVEFIKILPEIAKGRAKWQKI